VLLESSVDEGAPVGFGHEVHEQGDEPAPAVPVAREPDGVLDHRLVVGVHLFREHRGGDRRGLELEVNGLDRLSIVRELRGRLGRGRLGVRRHGREVPPHRLQVDPAIRTREPREVVGRALGQPRRPGPVPVGDVVDRGGELDEAVEEPLVIGARLQVEPVVLPGVVGGVVAAGVVDRDAGAEVGLHREAVPAGAAYGCRSRGPTDLPIGALPTPVRLEPRPRLVDWALLLGLAVVLATGVATMFAGEPADWWVVAVHAAVGLLLIAPVVWKLRRERRHLHPRDWSRSTASSILLSVLAVAAIATGIAWALGFDLRVLAWSGLVVHAFIGLALAPVLLLHLVRRFHVPRAADFEGRRTAIQAALLVAGAALAWRGQRVLTQWLRGAHRYTGSRDAGGDGNDFPLTSWVADDPAPVDADAWTLDVGGAVANPTVLDVDGVEARATDELAATLDCTSGWYVDRSWQGVGIGQLLEAVEPAADARWVTFESVTGYRFGLPIEEARETVLATHVGGERLTHGHGYPVRLVAPGRRGYQWVKWVESVEVRRTPDYGQWWAIFTSGFDWGP